MRCEKCGQENPPGARFCARCGTALAVTAESVPTTTPGMPLVAPVVTAPYAGFWARFGAAIIDFLIIFVAATILRFPLTFVLRSLSPDRLPIASATTFLFSPVILWLYFWLMTGLRGQTVGKIAVGIKVVDKEGKLPGLGRAALREVGGKTISAIILCLGFLWIAWDSQKQGLHDKIADTFVVKAR